MDLTPATNMATKVMNQTVSIQWGEIAWAVAIGLTSLLIFILIISGKFPGLSLKAGTKSLDINGAKEYSGTDRRRTSLTDEVTKAISSTAWILRKINNMERKIITSQKEAISNRRPDFFNAMETVQGDEIFTRLFLIEFEEVLSLAAEYNHILEAVNPLTCVIDYPYLKDKMDSLSIRYQSVKSLIHKGQEWQAIRTRVEYVLKIVLMDFAEIASKQREEVLADIEAIKLNLDMNDALRNFIDSVSEELQK